MLSILSAESASSLYFEKRLSNLFSLEFVIISCNIVLSSFGKLNLQRGHLIWKLWVILDLGLYTSNPSFLSSCLTKKSYDISGVSSLVQAPKQPVLIAVIVSIPILF